MKVVIRQTEDLELVQEIDRTCFAGTAPPLDGAELHDSVWWVATLNKEPVGYIGLQYPSDGRENGLILEPGCFFPRVGVIPAFRGGGLQKRLMRTMHNYARKDGVSRIFTYVWIGNIASLRSIERMGYLAYKWEWDEQISHAFIYLEKML